MILTRYHSSRSMSVQRIARDCKCNERTADMYLNLCGNEKKAIAYGKKKIRKSAKEHIATMIGHGCERAEAVMVVRSVRVRAAIERRQVWISQEA